MWSLQIFKLKIIIFNGNICRLFIPYHILLELILFYILYSCKVNISSELSIAFIYVLYCHNNVPTSFGIPTKYFESLQVVDSCLVSFQLWNFSYKTLVPWSPWNSSLYLLDKNNYTAQWFKVCKLIQICSLTPVTQFFYRWLLSRKVLCIKGCIFISNLIDSFMCTLKVLSHDRVTTGFGLVIGFSDCNYK
jgi:hypothetical protein